MQDATPPDGSTRPEDEDSKSVSQPRPAGLGPASALLRTVLGGRVPDGLLGPDTVPAAVLALPIALATEELVRHAKVCQNLRCPHVPPPLLHYRRMRPDAIRKAGNHVHKVLWTHSDHELVIQVRKSILARHSDVAQEIASGRLLEGARLEEVLNKLGRDAPLVLAGVLWATKFEGPSSEALFRLLVPIVHDGATRRAEAVAPDEQQEKSSKGELRRAERDRKQAERAAAQALQSLQLKERELGKANLEMQKAQRLYQEAVEEFDRLEAQLRDTEAAYQSLGRDAEKAARVNADLRRDLRQRQHAQRDLEVERSDLARKLAVERHQVERLKLKLDNVPRGLEAAWDFIRAEEERIKADRMILSGGAKTRAEQEWTAHRKLEKAFLDAYPVYRQPRPVKIRPKTSLRLVTLGGSGEVGRSCYLLELGKNRILVDCGIKPSGSEDVHPDIARLERIDALVLTHAHTDHIGWVPALVRRFPELDIYCSDGTAALLPVMLEDCHQHYMRNMAHRRLVAKYSRNAGIVEEGYDEEDVHAVPDLAITCRFDHVEALPFGDASIRFFRAGHILGASSVLIEDQTGRRIFFSGDFSSFPQLTVPAASWPDDLDQIDLLVLESTYGGKSHTPLVDSRRELVSFIRETVEGSQGSIILASFALGRAQELLSLITAARKSGELPNSVPVHVDGMIRRINPIYRKFANFDVAPADFNEVTGESERDEIALDAQRKPAIILTTSGMLTGGPVVGYARRLLPDARHRIVLTGYQDEGAPSKALLDLARFGAGQRVVEIADESGNPVRFEAAMPAKQVGLSSHADQPGLIEYASRLRPKQIALVHGEARAQEQLRSRLLQVHPGAEITSGPSELEVP